jgi:hypothetical protein
MFHHILSKPNQRINSRYPSLTSTFDLPDRYLTEEQIEMISHAASPETAEAVDI